MNYLCVSHFNSPNIFPIILLFAAHKIRNPDTVIFCDISVFHIDDPVCLKRDVLIVCDKDQCLSEFPV